MKYEVKQSGTHIDCLVINIDDLNIVVDQEVDLPDGSTKNVKKTINELAPQMFEYSLDRYTKLNKSSIVNGRLPINNVLEPVNLFLATLSKEEQTAIAMTIFDMHVAICQKFTNPIKTSELNVFTFELGDYLVNLDQCIDLINKISEFVSTSVPLGDFEEIGSREQDTAELTFQKIDVHGLTVIAILNKMLCPLFSVYMNILRNKKDITCDLGYELPCVFVLTKVLDLHYNPLIIKFKNYINHHIQKKNSCIGRDAALLLHLTSQTMNIKMYAQLLIRSLVNVDLYNMDRNLMSFVCRSILDAINSTAKNINECPVFIRKPAVKHQDEDTSGYLDVSSSVSHAPFDTQSIITFSITPMIKKYLATYAQIFSQEDFDQAMLFYRQNPIIPNAWNRFLANTFYRGFLGGCSAIQLLKSAQFNEVIACLQMIALKCGYVELTHILSAKRSSSACAENVQFSSCYRSSYYERVREIFEDGPIGPAAKAFDQHMSSIVTDIATHNWYFNTCIPIWDATEQEPMNGEPIPLKSVIEEGCGLILLAQEIENGFYEPEKPNIQ